MEYFIGDKIRVVKDFDCWLDSSSCDQLFTVVEDNGTGRSFCTDSNTCDLNVVNDWPEDFELVKRFIARNGVGIEQIKKEPSEYITVTVVNDNSEPTTELGKQIVDYVGHRMELTSKGLEIYDDNDQLRVRVGGQGESPSEPLGVYRPNLEDRKVGKVRVELVDDGFPLALREIAKVMTWAQTAKGYKDHDWMNLPNPEQALSGAASRHRTDAIIQRYVDKAEAMQCTDHESKLLHKAHEAFGVLAQLELILRGVIK